MVLEGGGVMAEHYTPQEAKRAKFFTSLACLVLLVLIVSLAVAVVNGYSSPLVVMMPAMMMVMMVSQGQMGGDYTPPSLGAWVIAVLSSFGMSSVTAVSSLVLLRFGMLLTLTDMSARGRILTVLALLGGSVLMYLAARALRELNRLLSMEIPTEKFDRYDDGDA